jgi:hypothetical protein
VLGLKVIEVETAVFDVEPLTGFEYEFIVPHCPLDWHTVILELPTETPVRTILYPFTVADTAPGFVFCEIENGARPDAVIVWLCPIVRFAALELNAKVEFTDDRTLTLSD